MAWSTVEKVGGITLSNSNKTATSSGVGNQRLRGDTYHNTGLYYCEIQGWAGTAGNIGLGPTLSPLDGGGFTYDYALDVSGNIHSAWDGSGTGSALGAIGSKTVCIAVDFTHNKIWFRLDNGNWNASGTANPATNVGGISITGHPALAPQVWFGGTTDHATLATTGADFLQTKPSGFSDWDTAETSHAYPVGFDVGSITSSASWSAFQFGGLTGDIAIVCVVSEPNSLTANDVTSVTDATGLTWTRFTKDTFTNGANTSKMNIEVWWTALTSNVLTRQNVTIHWGSAIDGASALLIMVRNAVSTTAPFDTAGPAFNSSTASATPTVSLSTNGEVAAFAIYGSLSSSFAATAGGGASGSPNFTFKNNNGGSKPAFLWGMVQDPPPTTSETSHSIAMPSAETDWGMLGFAIAGPTNTGGVSVSGTWASTEATDTLAATGGVGVLGTWASTGAPDTLAAAGISGINGAWVSTEAADVAAISGFARDSGIWVSTEASDTFAAAGTSGSGGISGTWASTEAPDTAAIVGFETDTGTWNSTEGVDIFAATGTVPFSGIWASLEAADRFSALGAGVTRVRRRRMTFIT